MLARSSITCGAWGVEARMLQGLAREKSERAKRATDARLARGPTGATDARLARGPNTSMYREAGGRNKFTVRERGKARRGATVRGE